MISKCYLKTNQLLKTKEELNKIRGVITTEAYVIDPTSAQKSALALYSESNKPEANYCVMVEYESNVVSLNKILKYYLTINQEDPMIYYFKKNTILPNKYNIESKSFTTLYPIDKMNKKSEEKEYQSNLINAYDLRDETYSVRFGNREYLLFVFLIGLAFIFIGEAFYIFPMLGAGAEHQYSLPDALGHYQGYASLASKILTITFILLFARIVMKKDIQNTKKKWWKYCIIVIVGFGLILGVSFLFDYLYQVWNIQKDATNEESVKKILLGESGIAYSICVASLTPFVEEFVFRKLLYSTIKYFKAPKWLNILLTAFLFALIHCLSEDFTSALTYLYLAQYFILSLIITLTYVFSDENVFASTFVHILNNILGLILLF